MKSHHLLHVFCTFEMGGPQIRTCDIIASLGPEYRHTIVAMDNGFAAAARLQGFPVEYRKIEYPKKNQSLLSNALRFRKMTKELHPDLLLTYNWGTIEWAVGNFLFPVVPHIHAEDGFGTDELGHQHKRRVWMRRFFLSHASHLIVPSRVLEDIALHTWKLSPKIIQYVPNGVDFQRFAGERVWEKKSGAKVGIVSGLRSVKNIPRLIRAFSSLPADTQAELWIVGEGSEKEKIEQTREASAHKGRIRLLGQKEDPTSIFQELSIFALSSESEQMPMSILEAMAAGCAILSTDVGDVRNMVCEENKRFIVPKEDEKLYAERLHELVRDASLCRFLGQKNQERCLQQYNKEDMLKEYKKIYEKFM